MKTRIVHITFPVLIKYEDEAGRKAAIKAAREYPEGGGSTGGPPWHDCEFKRGLVPVEAKKVRK